MWFCVSFLPLSPLIGCDQGVHLGIHHRIDALAARVGVEPGQDAAHSLPEGDARLVARHEGLDLADIEDIRQTIYLSVVGDDAWHGLYRTF